MPLYRLILIQLGKSNTGEESSNQGSPEPVRRKEEQEIQGVSSKKAIGALVDLEQEEGAEVAHSCTRFPCYLGMEI